jgi:hypothetical protein
MKTKRRVLNVQIDAGEIREETFRGRDYVVREATLMVGDIVVQPANAGGNREFVPSSVIAQSPAICNDSPMLMDHPPEEMLTEDGLSTDMKTLEALQLGEVYNSRFTDGKLRSEMWFDVAAIGEMSDGAQKMLERARDPEDIIEVSIAPLVHVVEENGVSPSGEEYDSRWVSLIKYDHVAALPKGIIGACSVETGCGMRTLASKVYTDKKEAKRVADEHYDSWIRTLADSEKGLLESISLALNSEHGWDFLGIVDILAGSGEVIFSLWSDESSVLQKQSYSVKSGGKNNGKVTLEGEPTAVVGRTVYENLKAAQKEESNMCRKKLLAQLKDKLGEETAKTLDGLSDGQLQDLLDVKVDELEQEPETVSTQEPDQSIETDTEANMEMLNVPKADWDALMAIKARDDAQQAKEKSTLVAELSQAQKVHSECDLNEMELEDLKKLSKLCASLNPTKVATYSLRGEPKPTEDPYKPSQVDSWNLNGTKEAN